MKKISEIGFILNEIILKNSSKNINRIIILNEINKKSSIKLNVYWIFLKYRIP